MTHKIIETLPKIALYEPDIPQNTAAIARTCSCLGAILEIIEPCGFIFNDRRFKRVVMDYLDIRMIKIYKSADEFFDVKKNDRIVLMTTKAKKKFKNFNFKNNDTLLFGRESAGVPKIVHKDSNQRLKIPIKKDMRSLNISMAAAIVLSEAIKQNTLF